MLVEICGALVVHAPLRRTMKGRQPGRPTEYVTATVNEPMPIGKPGVTFEVWEKWKRKLGTLTVSVGGLRWWPNNARKDRGVRWARVAEWFENS
jgi:hypothetical protein